MVKDGTTGRYHVIGITSLFYSRSPNYPWVILSIVITRAIEYRMRKRNKRKHLLFYTNWFGNTVIWMFNWQVSRGEGPQCLHARVQLRPVDQPHRWHLLAVFWRAHVYLSTSTHRHTTPRDDAALQSGPTRVSIHNFVMITILFIVSSHNSLQFRGNKFQGKYDASMKPCHKIS